MNLQNLSKQIQAIVDECINEGNQVESIETSFSNLSYVVIMKKPIGEELLEKYKENDNFLFWSYHGSPHNKADQGFKVKSTKEAIVFPYEDS